MREQNTNEAINKAISLLEDAIKACIEKRDRDLKAKVWLASSELEYATFLTSLVVKGMDASWKRELKSLDDAEVGPTLLAAQDLLQEAKDLLKSDLEMAYRRMWAARIHVLNAQRTLERAKRTT